MLRAVIFLCLALAFASHADSAWDAQASGLLEQALKCNPERLRELDEPVVLDVYRARGYAPLWSDEKGKLNRAFELLDVLFNADREGLEPEDYHLDRIRLYMDAGGMRQLIQLDLLLSAALYRYAGDVYSGRYNPGEFDPDWHIRNERPDFTRLFTDLAGEDSIAAQLEKLSPPHRGYSLLKSKLAQLREMQQRGGWKRLAWGPVLESGMQHEQVPTLKRRLEFSGDLVNHPFPESDIYDHWLEQAVTRYQERHGLKTDGRLGPQTRRSLNITVQQRIQQVRINMERWRWLPRKLGSRYLMVNMTGFELSIMQKDNVVMSMPVIIGNAFRTTPAISGVLSYMEYNPYWTVPKNLAWEDIVPKQISNPYYLKSRGIKVYRGWANPVEIDPDTVNWAELDRESFPYWLQQEPGPRNALGRVKFIFSNPYNVYLHGTPEKHLFDKVVRTFSSGCIRVKDPVRLAAFLLNDGSQQMEEDILASIHLGTNQRIDLPIAAPIYLVYWTAWVDEQGRLNFRDDVYRRDILLGKAFAP